MEATPDPFGCAGRREWLDGPNASCTWTSIPLRSHGGFPFFTEGNPARIMRPFRGGIAQLGERLHGMQEVSGSIPLTSTTKQSLIGPYRLEA